ncbi:MAG: methionyl-tRNA formyltransferase [Myxococcota bacterium]
MDHRFRLPHRRLRIAFFGTPDLASTVLREVLQADDDEVVSVICQPDRPKGRGRRFEAPPVKEVAQEAKIPVLQPIKLRDGVLTRRLLEDRVDLGVVVAFGRILPRPLFEAPSFGTVNVHASLLPKFRGASPIQHAILTGETETGVTLMRLSEGMDEGHMLAQRRVAIPPDATGGSLFSTLARLGAETLVDGLRQSKREGLPIEPQDPEAATYAPMLTKEDGRLDLGRDAESLSRRVRAFDPWPGTFLSTGSGNLKVLRARAVPTAGPAEPGVVVQVRPRCVLATSRGGLELLEVQPPGKRRMPVADFLRGQGRSWTEGSRVSAL